MKKLYFLVLLAMVSCKREPLETTQKGEFKVEFLFEKDGCKMYRFYDGRDVYWANCAGKVNADYSTRSGKIHTEHKEETITTE